MILPILRWPDVRLSTPCAPALPGPELARAPEIRMRWTDALGAPQEALLSGFAAICAQHEYDHLDGILTLDRLAPEDRARAEAEVIA